MQAVIASLRQLTLWSMMLRVVLAMLMGGLIGYERERTSHPAGFRTYMLVAIGASLTVMMSQYYDLMLRLQWADVAALVGSRTDMARFVGALTAELGKQDFTINAIAISYDGLIADPFGGVEDIRRQLIRCIGSPEERFAEQPQNMFRALQYAARLGFTVDLFTMGGIRTRAGLATMLPAEYVRDEVEKLLLSRAPETVFSLVELGLLSRYLAPGLPDPTLLRRLSRLPRKAQYRWAGLCRVLKLSGCIDLEERFLGALHLDHRTIRMAVDSGLMQESALPQSDLSRKRWLRTYGVETVRCALACRDAFTGSRESAELRRILKSGEWFSLKHLAVSGDDLLALGLRGRALGEMLDFLLEYVMEFPDNNRRELLLSLAAGTEE